MCREIINLSFIKKLVYYMCIRCVISWKMAEVAMTLGKIDTTTSRFIFESELKSAKMNNPYFEIKAPENFKCFTPDGQELLTAFMLSLFESLPVMEAEYSDKPIPESLICSIINVELIQGDDGFKLNIAACDKLLESVFKKNLADAVYKSLIELDLAYHKKSS